jgi:hypothetical protein
MGVIEAPTRLKMVSLVLKILVAVFVLYQLVIWEPPGDVRFFWIAVLIAPGGGSLFGWAYCVLHEMAHALTYRLSGVPRQHVVVVWTRACVAVTQPVTKQVVVRSLLAPVPLALLVTIVTIWLFLQTNQWWLFCLKWAAFLVAADAWLGSGEDLYWLLQLRRYSSSALFLSEGKRLVQCQKGPTRQGPVGKSTEVASEQETD